LDLGGNGAKLVSRMARKITPSVILLKIWGHTVTNLQPVGR